MRHRCLVKIITCCSSVNHHGQDFRAIVFEFMANGSLDRWIHSNFEGQNGQVTLSLSQRLDIAVDIVDALDYLHNGCKPPVIHCDLKPSNILLNQDMRARVGDFGIAKVLDEGTIKHLAYCRHEISFRAGAHEQAGRVFSIELEIRLASTHDPAHSSRDVPVNLTLRLTRRES